MVVLLIVLFIFFFVLPRVMPYLLKWVVKRHIRKAMGNAAGAAAGGPFGPFGRKNAAQQQQPTRPAKKIDPSVGEYVRFEEIEMTAETKTTADRTETKFTVEEQVVDVEWEDIK